jgi:hypothetical protein
MPRKARAFITKLSVLCYAGVHNRKGVFFSDQDSPYYLENIKEWKTEPGI